MRLPALKTLRVPAWSFVPIAIILALGCGPATGTITGKVFYNSTELKAGYVSFVSEDGAKNTVSPIAADGTYTIEKMPIGPVKISVETESLMKTSKAPRNEPPPGMVRPGDERQSVLDESAKRAIPIPAKFGDPKTSGLSYTVTSGSQSHDIELK
jgi:hypothetical protein